MMTGFERYTKKTPRAMFLEENGQADIHPSLKRRACFDATFTPKRVASPVLVGPPPVAICYSFRCFRTLPGEAAILEPTN